MADALPEAAAQVRLNRFLARAGVASRRRSDELIRSGVVRVNGQVADEPGRVVDPAVDRVECDGEPVLPPADFEYLVLHKPLDCLVTRRDTRGRRTVYEWLEGAHPGTVAVGRLDRDTTGLLLFMDDGELAFRLMHPRFSVEKHYEALVRGRPNSPALARLRCGVELEDGVTAPAQAELLQTRRVPGGFESDVSLRIHEGRKRQVRRMLRAVGHPVLALKRVGLGGLELDLDEPGQRRALSPAEVQQLAGLVGLERSATVR